MPNHITNIVRVKRGDFNKVSEAVKTDVRPFDFDRILPHPKELDGTSSPARVISDEEYEKVRNEEEKKDYRAISQSMSGDFIRRFGTNNWYDWNCQNWGTKWNAYSHDTGNDNEFIFDTAWSHPEPIIRKLSEMFPEYLFEVLFADEDWHGGNCGHYEIENGEIVEFEIEDEVRFSCVEVNGQDYDEYLKDIEDEE